MIYESIDGTKIGGLGRAQRQIVYLLCPVDTGLRTSSHDVPIVIRLRHSPTAFIVYEGKAQAKVVRRHHGFGGLLWDGRGPAIAGEGQPARASRFEGRARVRRAGIALVATMRDSSYLRVAFVPGRLPH